MNTMSWVFTFGDVDIANRKRVMIVAMLTFRLLLVFICNCMCGAFFVLSKNLRNAKILFSSVHFVKSAVMAKRIANLE